MSKTAVVILNYNGKNWLQKFIPNVLENSKEDADVVIIDNYSEDGSVEFIETKFGNQLQLIQLKQNFGFAGGYNKGLQHLAYDFYILLNSDVEVTPNWIKPIISQLEADTSIVAVQPKILSYKDKAFFEYAGAAGGFIDKYGYPFCRGRIFTTIEKDCNQYDDIKEVFWASGACFFVRASSFIQEGGFDESFFAHMEEIDLCWRLKNKGGKIFFNPNSTVFHVGGGTIEYESPRKIFLNFRNSLFMIHKNDNRNIFLLLFVKLVLDGAAGIRFLLLGKPILTLNILKAHLHYYKSISRLNKIREKQQNKDVKKLLGFYNKSILRSYFFKNKKTFKEIILN